MTGDKLSMPAERLDPGGHHRDKKSEPCRSYLGVISELNNAELVDTNASAAAREQETNGVC